MPLLEIMPYLMASQKIIPPPLTGRAVALRRASGRGLGGG